MKLFRNWNKTWDEMDRKGWTWRDKLEVIVLTLLALVLCAIIQYLISL